MEVVFRHLLERLSRSGMASPDDVHIATCDDTIAWHRPPASAADFAQMMNALRLGTLLFGAPMEPYRTLIAHQAAQALAQGQDAIFPSDSETRTFLHRIPCLPAFTPAALAAALANAAVVISAQGHVASRGFFSPFEALVHFSSACFAAQVRFVVQSLDPPSRATAPVDVGAGAARRVLLDHLRPLPHMPPQPRAPFHSEAEVLRAIAHAGRSTVHHRLVDSAFGNASLLHDGVLYISQTGAPLDELEGQIDACHLDDSHTNAITASSELAAHLAIVQHARFDGVLHGHPPMTVALSMHCDLPDCAQRHRCHTHCQTPRSLNGVPIVCGEVGAGDHGLCHTVPAALAHNDAAIVLGHGVFVGATGDFCAATQRLCDIENAAAVECKKRISRWWG
ncbi:MAG: rRNA adenine dimethylase [Myxococcales bacterium]|nr:rRNA adenine dimethylase [Myxococcales bacterium]